MEISKIPYPDLSLQSLPYSLHPDQLRERLITLDFRENDVFRFALGCEDEKSRKIRFAYLSALFHIQVVRADIKNTEPMKTYEREKGVRFDLLIEVEDDKGQILLVNIEMQNYQMGRRLSLRSQGYLARIVADQLNANNLYEFNPVVQLMILNRSPQVQEWDGYLHHYRYFSEEKGKRLPDERCQILWIEMDKLEELESKPVEEWKMEEKIHYMLRFSHVAEKQNIIHELVEKEEIIKMMEEKKVDFLRDTSLAIARLRAKFDELDYELEIAESRLEGKREGKHEGRLEGKLEGQRTLIKLVLGKRMELSTENEKQIDSLDEQALLELTQVIDTIYTSQDLHHQIQTITKQNSRAAETILSR
ncbi:PD-(D/E)XK nuclease family transposase [Holdemania massiliensis]|nr:PD-(D/E)XK nuclease family transposase [Holdemania massiliensis]